MSTPYKRLIEQQDRLHQGDTPVGYAVAIAGPRTERAAYLTGDNDDYLTNDERAALVAGKEEVSRTMDALVDTGDWYKGLCWRIAFLVPVFDRTENNRNGLPTVCGY